MRASASRSEFLALIRLALPLCAGQVGFQLLSFVDAAVVGRLGAVPLAGVGLGNAIFFAISILGMGAVMGLDPLMAQAFGAKDPARSRHLLWQGTYLALAATALLTLPLLVAPYLLVPFGIDPQVAEITRSYLSLRALTLFPAFLFTALRSFLQAEGRGWPLVLSTVLANAVNYGANVALVLGGAALPAWVGPLQKIPALGVPGSAWATLLASLTQVAVLSWGIGRRPLPMGQGDVLHRRPDYPALRSAARVGLPIGFQMAAEVGIFSLAGLLAGRMGAQALASHQVALNLASMTFMVALGISSATSVRVGQAIGAQDLVRTRRAGFTAFAVGGGFMSLAALAFLLIPQPLARLITQDPQLIAAAVPLLAVAAAFQVSDGLQAVGSGVLRGAGDTRFAFLANLAGHWAVGLPIALFLGVMHHRGVIGLWVGLAAGLSAVAVVLFSRFTLLSRKPIRPLEAHPSPH